VARVILVRSLPALLGLITRLIFFFLVLSFGIFWSSRTIITVKGGIYQYMVNTGDSFIDAHSPCAYNRFRIWGRGGIWQTR
jgi:hypothetical protein